MHLLLELGYSGGTPDERVDVRVDLDVDHTVAALTDTLVAFGVRRGWALTDQELALWRSGSERPLDPTALVLDTGMVSGETVTLAAKPRAAPETGHSGQRPHGAAPALSLDVTTGPEAGRIVALAPGTFTVGRGNSCTVIIDDPTLSREHFLVHVDGELQVTLAPNPAAKNGTAIGAAHVTAPRRLPPGEVVQAGSSAFAVRIAASDATRRRDRLGQVPLNRVPYRRTVVTPRRFDDLAAPPRSVDPRRLSLATAVAPAISAVALAVMMQRWYLLVLAGLTPLLFVYRWASDQRGGRRTFARDRAAFIARVEARAAEVDRALVEERRERLDAAPDLADLARQAMFHMPRLWERNRGVGDVLNLRLGLGDLESEVSAAIDRGGDDQLRAAGMARLAHQHTVRDVPVAVNLIEVGTIGIWGDAAQVTSAGSALLVQAACLHSPEDVVIAAALGPADVDELSWLKWLPHVRSATSPVEGQHLVVGPDATRGLMLDLLTVAAARSERQGAPEVWPRLLVALCEGADPDRALLSRLLDVGPAHGIHVVWMGESELQVPRQCQALVGCTGAERAARLTFTEPSLPQRTVELDGVRSATASAIARSLAPLRDASASTQTTAIPRVVPLLDLLGMGHPSASEIMRRWRRPHPYGLRCTVGMAADGPFDLDLVAQGPHTLIGGTSGAGKSEMLQTLVLSLASSYSPERLNFLFVDYKGGASSAELQDLPHTVGYVTNLSGRLSMRALTSLRAELQRRMGLLEGRAKDIAEMLQVAPDEAPPSLVIVVDEFAALVKEVPDFVAGIVDIAQRGRSLGIHLVLATQRPTGVVNDNILANTNLRIALRVLDPSDSASIIGARDAADIPVPLRGRAYARTGPQALMPFQCAWSGAPMTTADAARIVSVSPFALAPSGPGLDGDDRPGQLDLPRPSAGADPVDAAVGPTHLDVLVDACVAAASELGSPPARRPWVEPLGDVVALDDVLAAGGSGASAPLPGDPGRGAVIGLADDPEHQAQPVASVDFEETGGLLVFGMGGSGKTTLLRTIAAGLAEQGDAAAVRIHALDFASRGLDALADLPHCGEVIPGDDLERVTRLITVLTAEIDRRTGVLADASAETLGALRSRLGGPVMPRIVVLLDSYSGLHSAFDRRDGFYGWLTAFHTIVSGGRHVGVHCVIATERRLGLPAPLISAISARLALRMAGPDELASLGVPMKVAKDADLAAGRGYLDAATEVQVACVSAEPSGLAQSEALAARAKRLCEVSPARAPRLPELPDRLTLDHSPREPLRGALGVADLSLDVVEIDLNRQSFVVAGPPLSGRSTALATVVRGVRASSPSGLHIAALGSTASPLARLDVWDDAAFSRSGRTALVARLAERLADDEGVAARVLLVIDAAEDMEGTDVVRPLDTLVRHDALRLAVACEPATLAKAYSGWVSVLRRNRTALVLQPESRAEVEATIGVKVELRPGQQMPPGRGVVTAHRGWHLVQVGQSSV